jgi:thiaminase/transcriptional activator TenA
MTTNVQERVHSATTSDPASRPEGSLTAALWASSAPTFDAILRLPFITQLVDGSLTEEQFTYYLMQDNYYMRAYNRSLATIAAKAPTQAITDMFIGHIVGAIGLESGLHAELIAMMGTEDLTTRWPEQSPTGLAYSNALSKACERGSFLEGLVSLLPCYWIYARVGAELQGSTSPHPAYARWIESYGDGVFENVVVEALACVDEVGAAAGAAERERCLELYRSGSRYEWMFWDAAHRLESWPDVLSAHA